MPGIMTAGPTERWSSCRSPAGGPDKDDPRLAAHCQLRHIVFEFTGIRMDDKITVTGQEGVSNVLRAPAMTGFAAGNPC